MWIRRLSHAQTAQAPRKAFSGLVIFPNSLQRSSIQYATRDIKKKKICSVHHSRSMMSLLHPVARTRAWNWHSLPGGTIGQWMGTIGQRTRWPSGGQGLFRASSWHHRYIVDESINNSTITYMWDSDVFFVYFEEFRRKKKNWDVTWWWNWSIDWKEHIPFLAWKYH